MDPLAATAFKSGMSVVEELKLLKSQVQDVARVCNTVARGDLSQKIGPYAGCGYGSVEGCHQYYGMSGPLG